MTDDDYATKLDRYSRMLRRSVDDAAVYNILTDSDVPEEAKEELYKLLDEADELADRLNRAAEIIRDAGRDE